MATIVLSAVGAAFGAGFGGTILGLSGAVIGRSVGATIGRAIDQRLLGSGSAAVETGRIDRFRLTGASEGAPVGRIWGRVRVAGQVIWATRFAEKKTTSGGGKGAPSGPSVTQYSYSVSLAVALCEGEITRLGRVWADGIELETAGLNLRVYCGSEDQLPDPKIEAVEGAGRAPAYRGIAYVVFENLQLEKFGNRVPQLTFEVVRPAQGPLVAPGSDLGRAVRAVALIPGTGEYALATTAVHYAKGLGENVAANVHSAAGGTDFAVALRALDEELPACGSVSLVVSWFGDDLRCGACRIRPKVETRDHEGRTGKRGLFGLFDNDMAWQAGGILRLEADEVPRIEGRSVYGGTPSDQSVREAIAALKAAGKSVVFYPFILMDQLEGNGLPDPWGGAEQAALPWRGRITLSVAPGQSGSPDRSATAADEVAAFFGQAAPDDFSIEEGRLVYAGPPEWSLRRFVLHYAHLCAMAGGVDAFCISSELVSLTRVRGSANSFPAVAALRALAADVRAILGPGCKIGYAADWSEYFGDHPGNGEVFFHLDPLWADVNIDFIGIDNYMPLSDWRDGDDHADAGWGSIYDLDYLKANIAGGEGYSWYYAAPEHRDAQIRTPIRDGAHGEDWIWRYKDLRGWWENVHHDRVAGVRAAEPTDWVPRSKPIWFTEIGCAAVDKGSNQPNRFLDPKSSESGLPHYSDGRRDELIQMQYLRAVMEFWGEPANNPVSDLYGGPMVDAMRAHVWAWDARPYPQFPGLTDVWSDGANYARGHWISGRVGVQPLANVVAEICAAAGLRDIDVSRLHGLVRGYALHGGESGRAALQGLMLAYGFDAAERDGKIVFRLRDGRAGLRLGADDLALGEGPRLQAERAPEAETAGRVRLAYVGAEGDYEVSAVEAVFPDEAGGDAAQSELPLALTRSEAQRIVERWLSEARVARDGVRFSLPPSLGHMGAGDVLELDMPEARGRYRIDRAEQMGALEVEAVRVEPAIYLPSDEAEGTAALRPFAAPVPVYPVFLDLPLMRGTEDPAAPHLAVTALPWPGSVAVYAASEDAGYGLNRLLNLRATIGVTQGPLVAARPGVWDRGVPLRVALKAGALESVSEARLLDGANVLAIGDGSSDRWELIQFASAVLVAPGLWEIGQRLRGQAGTDGIMPEVWPAGSTVVLIDTALSQIDLAPANRGLARHYRIGPAGRSYDDPSYLHLEEAFAGIGLRPYAPCHLRLRREGGDLRADWVRRTRIDGDSWESLEVPLGEARERYRVRVIAEGLIRREVEVTSPGWTYSAAMQEADAVTGPFELNVAQLSDAFGAGPSARIMFND
ncbi:host specificity protein [Rhodobacter veldkampii DSM 11550]|uniref:Host specificity protein n=1 Tax=Phaeovulum veldkampii DSM 11550 TaxID=1185920 RepID=A0A2T4JMY4_9RHOB|nr:glycoside hydrolase/phage tail family protein [Phaeovulum veldkampii]MBK5945782.1 host specificity protein [Phaeovulum veldkampii DSM 11550]PTE19275.1 host specificity protein [Phaeovulum veldkampii DSM 11550]TDQ62238.1 putative tail protein [Phaeovulum veldkampii DSM 11550]